MKEIFISGQVIKTILIRRQKDLTGFAVIMWVVVLSCGAVKAIAGAKQIFKPMQKMALLSIGRSGIKILHHGTLMLKNLRAYKDLMKSFRNYPIVIFYQPWN